MVVLFGLASFAGAALLFAVEPMAAKALLPLLGGTAAVWSTCLAFFQGALLLGYLYAHATSRFSPRIQAGLHLSLLALCVILRPVVVVAATDHPPLSGDPTAWLLGRLMTTLGLSFVALAATSSILQRWYAASRGGADPYPLYAASNLGSLLALIAYPLLLEPSLPLAEQARAWRWGFAGFFVLMAGCAAGTIRASRQVKPATRGGVSTIRRDWLLWVALAFLPSSLLQGVTTYLTTDIAPIPLLWVVPLGLYLLSFVLTFASRRPIPHALSVRSLPIAALLLLPPLAAGLVQWFWMPVHLLFFFVAAMACHGELARRRPPTDELTGFYLAIALGGVLGSLFNAVLAPLVFDRMAEYPVAIVLACLAPVLAMGRDERVRSSLVLAGAILVLIVPVAADLGGVASTALGAMCVSTASGLFLYVVWTHRRRPIAFALSVAAVLLGTGLSPGVGGRILRRERNFYGILRVTEDDTAHARRLFHGWTLHGQQSTEPGREREPTTYYLPGGPASQVFETLNARQDAARVAIVGLGIGGLTPYAKPRQAWTFYELDPAVEAVARDASLFTYLRDCPAASVDVVLGDARLRLADAPDHSFDLIVLDAFSSDAIPVHLLTREALALYLSKRSPRGLIAYHISTRHLDLEPILGALARECGQVARIRRDVSITPDEKNQGKQPTVWVVLADSEEDLDPISDDPRWPPVRAGASVWTDDRSSLLDALKVGRGARGGR